MSTLKTNNIEHIDASTPSVQMSVGGGVVFPGISTFTGDATFSAGVSIGGTLTYDDVTSIDSVGIITAQSGIHLDDSIVHLGDTNTKIRFPAADTITAETGGTERLRVTSAGKVGVGITNPTFELDVDGRLRLTHGSSGLLFEEVSNGAYLWLDGANGDFSGGDYYGIAANNNGKLQLGYVGAAHLVLNNSGDVGIGEADPDRKLVISQANSTAYSGTDFDQNYHVLKLNNTTDSKTVGMQFLIGANGEAAITATETSDGATDLAFGTRGSGNRAERLRITSAGRIGMGVDNPENTLHVKNASNAATTIRIQTGEASNDIADGDEYASIIFDGSSYTGAKIGSNRDDATWNDRGDLRFYSGYGNNVFTERMRITNGGNIGMGGVTNPEQYHANANSLVSGGGITLANATGGYIYFADSSSGTGEYVGQIGYDHGSDYMNFVVNNTERMRISSAGYVTKPNHPAFRVFRNQSNWNVAGSTKFDFDSVVFNTGSHYSTSTDRFTVPVTGVYQFNFSIILYGSNLTSEWVSLRVNNSRVTGGDLHFSIDYSNNRWHNVSYSHTMYLSANDYVEMWNGGGSVDYHGDNWAQFSGHLVG